MLEHFAKFHKQVKIKPPKKQKLVLSDMLKLKHDPRKETSTLKSLNAMIEMLMGAWPWNLICKICLSDSSTWCPALCQILRRMQKLYISRAPALLEVKLYLRRQNHTHVTIVNNLR